MLLGRPAARDQRDGQVAARRQARRRGDDVGRATDDGALTVVKAPTSVPWSVGRTGRYWPDGHQAQASRATRPQPRRRARARRGGRRRSSPTPCARSSVTQSLDEQRHAGHGSASANRRTTRRAAEHVTAAGLVGNRRDEVGAALPRRGCELREQQDGAERHREQDRDDDRAPTRSRATRAQPFSADGSRSLHGAGAAASGPCARRGPARRSRRTGCGSRRPGTPARGS